MEDKIQKLFLCLEGHFFLSIFTNPFFLDTKNEKLFELCISQLSEIYRENFSLGVKILEKVSLNQQTIFFLIFIPRIQNC